MPATTSTTPTTSSMRFRAGNFPAVSFIKAPGYQDGHSGYSDPLDEQTFVVDTINFLMSRPEWKNTAVVINWDDSDGWYDHQMGPIVDQSQTSQDALNGPGLCGSAPPALAGITGPHAQGRCGYGPRLPLLGDFALDSFQRGRSHSHGPEFDDPFHRGQLAGGQRIGDGAFDGIANSIDSMFTFVLPSTCYRTVILDDQTGKVTQKGCAH